ncbi:MAG: PAS domain S-box protein [Proteobacteria bacterium]|nr:PAS domain S-box protein [Pseudomonadota bacterium]
MDIQGDHHPPVTKARLSRTTKKERNLLQILDNLPDGLFATDDNGRIDYFNAAAEEITGLSASEATGMNCKDVFRSPTCETDCPLTPATQSGKSTENREFVITRRDGKTVPIICSASILRDSLGKVTGRIGVFKDISVRKRLEDNLRLSESKYRRIFEGSKDMIFITAKNGRIKEVNQACVDLLDYSSKGELLSLATVEEIYDNPMHWQVFQKQIDRHGFVKDFEAAFKKKDGTRLHCLLSGNAVRSEDEKIIGYEGIAKDITARMDAVRSLRQRHRELWLLNSVALAMNKTHNLDDVLMIAVKKVLKVLSLNSGGIFLIDHERNAFALRAKQGLPHMDKPEQLRFHDSTLMRSLLDKNLCLKPEPIFPPFRASLNGLDTAGVIELTCFLITAKEKASGFLALEVPPNRDLTTGQDFHLLGSLGNFLGGAIENARLLQTIHKHREELKRLTAELFHSQEIERRRIARELHDEAGQALTGINFTLETIEKTVSPDSRHIKTYISDIKEQITRTYQEMRRISYKLHPVLLSDLGLEPALESYLTELSRYSHLDIDFKMVGFEERLDLETETVLYRLAQEALTNTIKHARANHFKLSIIKSYPRIIFLVEDDGRGFDSLEYEGKKQALGLLGMRERASMLGGSFSIRTSRGKGTGIRIEIPIKESSSE